MHLLQGLLKSILQGRFQCLSIFQYIITKHLPLTSSLYHKHRFYVAWTNSPYNCIKTGKEEGTDKVSRFRPEAFDVRVLDTRPLSKRKIFFTSGHWAFLFICTNLACINHVHLLLSIRSPSVWYSGFNFLLELIAKRQWDLCVSHISRYLML